MQNLEIVKNELYKILTRLQNYYRLLTWWGTVVRVFKTWTASTSLSQFTWKDKTNSSGIGGFSTLREIMVYIKSIHRQFTNYLSCGVYALTSAAFWRVSKILLYFESNQYFSIKSEDVLNQNSGQDIACKRWNKANKILFLIGNLQVS